MKGQIARRAMLLGTGPLFSRRSIDGSVDQSVDEPKPKPPPIAHIRLISAMRKIDPDLARMIESLAPVYLVKK